MNDAGSGGVSTHTLLNADLISPSVHPFLRGAVAAFSRRSPKKDSDNEDCAAFLEFDPGSGVLAVADGLGGLPAGADASRRVVGSLLRTLSAGLATGETSLREVILDGIEQANRELLDTGVGSATTLVVAEINHGVVRSYHVGDAMLLVTGQRGRVKLHTISHSPTGYALEAGLIDEEEAMVHRERHIVSNVIGSSEMRIEMGPEIKLSPRDTVLLSSDGVFDNLYQEEIIDTIRMGPIRKAADRLHLQVDERMAMRQENHPHHPDDCTFLLFRPMQ